jgi:hypothetical protein
MIMAVTQRFALQRPSPNLPGEWVCAGCEAPIAEASGYSSDPAPGTEREAVPAAEMTHSEDCPEVGKPTLARA